MKLKFLFITAALAAGVTMFNSCESEDFSPEKSAVLVDKLLSSVNVQDAAAIYYKGDGSRASSTSGYFKMDINGNEVQLQFSDAEGKIPSFEIPIINVVNASSRYLIVQPNMMRVVSIITSEYYNKAPADDEFKEVANACDITCIADKSTGTIYRIPGINIETGANPIEQNGICYFVGIRENAGMSEMNMGTTTDGPFNQVFAFNPSNLTVSSLLPEGQQFYEISVNSDGFVAYYGDYEQSAKVKCPGGSIKVISDVNTWRGKSLVYTINGTFYAPDYEAKVMNSWTPNGTNDLTSSVVCSIPEYLDWNPWSIYDQQKGIYLFKTLSSDETGERYITWKFDGTSFTDLNIDIPSEFFIDTTNENRIYQTADAWYVKKNDSILLKLAKSDYALTNVDISNYQIFEIVSNESGADLSFTGIRYSDSKKVIGKIKADNSIVIESAQTSSENIYNLVPLN